MSQHIPSAKVFGKVNEQYDDGGNADSRGFQARQHGAPNRDVDVNNGQRFILGTDTAPPDVTGREMAENERLNSMVKKINEIVGPTQSSSRNADMELRQKFESIGFGDIMDGGMGGVDPVEMGRLRAAQQPRQPAMQDDLTPPSLPPQQPVSRYIVEALSGTTKSGQRVPFWQVTDARSNQRHAHRFRLEEVARKVQTILNRTGNPNDPRIQQWVEVDKRRLKMISDIRMLKEAVRAGNKQARSQLVEAQDALAELDLKIGI